MADRLRLSYPARFQEKGVFVDVGVVELDAAANPSVHPVINVPAGVTVLETVTYTDDLGVATTLDVGDGDNDDYFNTAIDTDGAAAVTRSVGAPLFYEVADTIDVTVGGGAATGTVYVVAYMTAEQVSAADKP